MPYTRYPEIVVTGSPREMGRQPGESARDEIRGFAEIALQRVNKTVRVSRERALSIAARSTEFARRYCPEMLEELHGMADSSHLPFHKLMLLQVRNQLRPDADAGCTSLALASPAIAAKGTIVAQRSSTFHLPSCQRRSPDRLLADGLFGHYRTRSAAYACQPRNTVRASVRDLRAIDGVVP